MSLATFERMVMQADKARARKVREAEKRLRAYCISELDGHIGNAYEKNIFLGNYEDGGIVHGFFYYGIYAVLPTDSFSEPGVYESSLSRATNERGLRKLDPKDLPFDRLDVSGMARSIEEGGYFPNSK